MMHNRKMRSEAVEKAQAKLDGEPSSETNIDSPALHKDDLLDDEENEISENESVGTQPEEVTFFLSVPYYIQHFYLK